MRGKQVGDKPMTAAERKRRSREQAKGHSSERSERGPYKAEVGGSSPPAPTKIAKVVALKAKFDVRKPKATVDDDLAFAKRMYDATSGERQAVALLALNGLQELAALEPLGPRGDIPGLPPSEDLMLVWRMKIKASTMDGLRLCEIAERVEMERHERRRRAAASGG